MRWFASGIVAMVLTGCSTVSRNQAREGYVRKVDCSEAPQAKVLAERARQLGNQMYPGVCALLEDGNSRLPRHFEICIKKSLPNGNSGVTRMFQVCLNAQYLEQWQNDPGTFNNVVIHEMAHVAQHYERPILGRWIVVHHNPPRWLVEGIADYVSFKLGETNGWRCAECTSVFPEYRDGYTCAGALLLYLEKTYNDRLVSQLNRMLRHGGYSEEFFVKMTGKDLPTLWAELRQTAAFTPGAARMLELRQSLGYVDGKAPKDLELRFNLLADVYPDVELRKLITQSQVHGLQGGEIQGRLAILCYFTQPGGTAEAFLSGLQNRKQLPGFPKAEHGTLTGTISARDLNPAYPVTRSFTATKQGDTSIYHYSVYRGTQKSDWKLQRAWRTSSDGRVTEEYVVP